MNKKKKKLLAISAVALLTTALAGCGSSNSDTNTGIGNNAPSNTQTEGNKPADSGKVPTLVWWTIGGQMPANFDKALAAMNEDTAEKINVKVDIRGASWGDWDTKINTVVNTGEPFDIMFTNNSKYSQQVALGAFADLTDSVQSETPDLFKLIPEKVWDGTKIDGVAALRQAIVRRPDVFATTMTEKLFTYGLGRGLTYRDLPAVRGIVRGGAAHEYRFSSIVLGIVQSRPFQMKMAEGRPIGNRSDTGRR